MKRLLVVLAAVFVLLPVVGQAQTTGTARRFVQYGTAPSNCAPGSVYYDSGTGSSYYCNNSQTWIGFGASVTGSVSNQAANAIPTNTSGTATALDSTVCTPPATPGRYDVGYTVPSTSSVAPDCVQVGLVPRSVTGATDTILFSDNDSIVEYQGSVAVAVSLPTPATLSNANFFVVLNSVITTNNNITVTPAGGYTINGAATKVIPQYARCSFNVDPASATNWLSSCFFDPGSFPAIGTRTPAAGTFTTASAVTYNGTYYADRESTGGDGTSGTPWIGWDAWLVTLAGSAHVVFPCGYYNASGIINLSVIASMKYKWWLQGSGKECTIIQFGAASGDGFFAQYTQNSSTPAYIEIDHMTISDTNATNAGAAFDQEGGTYVSFHDNKVIGFKFGVIYDQTEISSIEHNTFWSGVNTGADIWLVNGADHWPGAAQAYTNRISVLQNDFESTNTLISVVDDGGVSHAINQNNFENGTIGIRQAACTACTINENEMEGETADGVYLDYVTWQTSTVISPDYGLRVANNSILLTSVPPIYSNDLHDGVFEGNSFQNTTAGIQGISAQTNEMTLIGNQNYSNGPITNMTPPRLCEINDINSSSGLNVGGCPLVTWFSSGVGTSSTAPSSSGNTNGSLVNISSSVTFSSIYYQIGTLDSSGTDLYDIGLYRCGLPSNCASASTTATLLCDIGPTAMTTTGEKSGACVQSTPITIQPGVYAIAITGNATTAKFTSGPSSLTPWGSSLLGTSTGGQLVNGTTPTAGTALTVFTMLFGLH